MTKTIIRIFVLLNISVILSCSWYVDYKKNQVKESLLEQIDIQKNKVLDLMAKLSDKYGNLVIEKPSDLLAIKRRIVTCASVVGLVRDTKVLVSELDKDYRLFVKEFNKLNNYLKSYSILVQGGLPCPQNLPNQQLNQ